MPHLHGWLFPEASCLDDLAPSNPQEQLSSTQSPPARLQPGARQSAVGLPEAAAGLPPHQPLPALSYPITFATPVADESAAMSNKFAAHPFEDTRFG